MKYRAWWNRGRIVYKWTTRGTGRTFDFTLAPGEHARFQTVNRGGRFTWFLVGTLGVGPMYVHIERVPDPVDQAP